MVLWGAGETVRGRLDWQDPRRLARTDPGRDHLDPPAGGIREERRSPPRLPLVSVGRDSLGYTSPAARATAGLSLLLARRAGAAESGQPELA
jgi:hypothetical protein